MKCTSVAHGHARLFGLWVFSRVHRRVARKGPACTPRRKCGSRPVSVAAVVGVHSLVRWQGITGSHSAEPEPTRPMETPIIDLFCSYFLLVPPQLPNKIYFDASSVQQQRRFKPFLFNDRERCFCLCEIVCESVLRVCVAHPRILQQASLILRYCLLLVCM